MQRKPYSVMQRLAICLEFPSIMFFNCVKMRRIAFKGDEANKSIYLQEFIWPKN